MLAIIAMHALLDTERPVSTDKNAQVEWQRKQLVLADRSNGHPHLNGVTLVSMIGSVDYLAEQLAPSYREIWNRAFAKQVTERMLSNPELVAALRLNSDEIAHFEEACIGAAAQRQDRIPVVAGAAPGRWEAPLSTVGLGADPNRPIPPSLDEALSEVTGLRNVLVHRGGRIDTKALKSHPSLAGRLGLQEGQFIRIDSNMYRRYSAALRTYAGEVERRVLAKVGIELPRQLAMTDWQNNHYVGA